MPSDLKIIVPENVRDQYEKKSWEEKIRELRKFKNRIDKFRPEKDDVIVLRVGEWLGRNQTDIAKYLGAMFPHNKSMLVTGGEADVFVGRIIEEGEKKITITRKVI
jgi:hypothetical protein